MKYNLEMKNNTINSEEVMHFYNILCLKAGITNYKSNLIVKNVKHLKFKWLQSVGGYLYLGSYAGDSLDGLKTVTICWSRFRFK